MNRRIEIVVNNDRRMTETERLQVFLYLLLRDEVNFGAIEKALQAVNQIDDARRGVNFSEKSQAAYAACFSRSILDANQNRGHG